MVRCHTAAMNPAPQPMKKPRAGSSHVDPPLRNGQSASPAVSVRHERCTEDGGLGARVTERACGAATPSFPIAAEPPSLRRDRRRKDGASRRPSNSSSCGSESSRRWCARRPRRSLAHACLADQAAEQAVIAAEADWLGRVPPGGAPAKQPAKAGRSARQRRSHLCS